MDATVSWSTARGLAGITWGQYTAASRSRLERRLQPGLAALQDFCSVSGGEAIATRVAGALNKTMKGRKGNFRS